jgi:hypothetical protein
MGGPPAYGTYDEVVVLQYMRGEVSKTVPRRRYAEERAEAIIRLVGQGYSDGQIADRTGLWRRSVERVRMRLGVEAPNPPGSNLYTRLRALEPARPHRAG